MTSELENRRSTAATRETGEPQSGRRGRTGDLVAVAVWATLIVVALVWGQALLAAGRFPFDYTFLAPFHGALRSEPLTTSMLTALAVAALGLAVLPRAAARLPWRPLLLGSWAGSAVWTVTLAVSEDGWSELADPVDSKFGYLAGLPAVGDQPLQWLRTFTTELPAYTTHIRGHPPLPVLILWTLDHIGLSGAGWAAALIIALGTSAVVAIAVTTKVVAGEAWARRAMPYLVLAPLALFVATSMDALFLGVTAWGAALLALAARRDSLLGGAVAGVVLGAVPYLSYGLLPVGAVLVAVLWAYRSRRALVGALAAAGLVTVAFVAGGFWWLEGMIATHAEWAGGVGTKRPYGYYLLANVAVLGVLVGPATAVALGRLRPLRWARAYPTRTGRPLGERGLWALVVAGLLAMTVLDLAGVTRGEVERIWLPFAPWALLACATLARPGRGWLAAQALTAVAVQALVTSPW